MPLPTSASIEAMPTTAEPGLASLSSARASLGQQRLGPQVDIEDGVPALLGRGSRPASAPPTPGGVHEPADRPERLACSRRRRRRSRRSRARRPRGPSAATPKRSAHSAAVSLAPAPLRSQAATGRPTSASARAAGPADARAAAGHDDTGGGGAERALITLVTHALGKLMR